MHLCCVTVRQLVEQELLTLPRFNTGLLQASFEILPSGVGDFHILYSPGVRFFISFCFFFVIIYLSMLIPSQQV
jgi:hypothetical protein